MKKTSILMLVSLYCLILAHPSRAGARESCRVCGMYLDVYHKTAAYLVDSNGTKIGTCGVTDMIREINDAGGPGAFTSIKVRGFSSGTEIDAEKASYVIGSDVIPDMLPNIIAFVDQPSAEKFISEHGGKSISFSQAILSIAPMGMTIPTRLKTAVLPGRGASMAGIGRMRMVMDEVALGSDHVDPADLVQRPMQMMGPKKMTTDAWMFMAAHSFTDRDNLSVKIIDYHKEMDMYTNGGAKTSTTENNGLGDVEVDLRHGLWHDDYYSSFLTALGTVTLPTGDFDTDLISSSGLQLGKGAFGFGAGLLYSKRVDDFWFHSSLSYKHFLENSDDYQYGDTTSLACALHYTPNYDLMLGLEVDGSEYGKNEYQGIKQGNTGGFRSYATAVATWKFLTALGGNFKIKATYGVPIYEDMNHYRVGAMEKAQMGGGYMSSVSLSFSRRFEY